MIFKELFQYFQNTGFSDNLLMHASVMHNQVSVANSLSIHKVL